MQITKKHRSIFSFMMTVHYVRTMLQMAQRTDGKIDFIDYMLAGLDISHIEGHRTDIMRDIARAQKDAAAPLLLLETSLEKILPPAVFEKLREEVVDGLA